MGEVEDHGCSNSEMSWAEESEEEPDFIGQDSQEELDACPHTVSYTIIDRHQLGCIQVCTYFVKAHASSG